VLIQEILHSTLLSFLILPSYYSCVWLLVIMGFYLCLNLIILILKHFDLKVSTHLALTIFVFTRLLYGSHDFAEIRVSTAVV